MRTELLACMPSQMIGTAAASTPLLSRSPYWTGPSRTTKVPVSPPPDRSNAPPSCSTTSPTVPHADAGTLLLRQSTLRKFGIDRGGGDVPGLGHRTVTVMPAVTSSARAPVISAGRRFLRRDGATACLS